MTHLKGRLLRIAFGLAILAALAAASGAPYKWT
jgi:hypothetical protein